ncbi:MAG: hypothetical protein HY424_01275 [Candidatus Levybacteria bacterium]|nr:hypothetical protein [Candidatus Levybacteria bacterium]
MFHSWNEIIKGCVYDSGGKDVATLSCIPAIFSNMVNALLTFTGLIALAIFIFGGFKFIHSGGDPKKLEGARNNLIYGILGLLIVLLSFGIINIIVAVTGVECIRNFGFGC